MRCVVSMCPCVVSLCRRWRRVSISVKGNSVTLFDNCKEVETKKLDRSDADLDTSGVVFVGAEYGMDAKFEVGIISCVQLVRHGSS